MKNLDEEQLKRVEYPINRNSESAFKDDIRENSISQREYNTENSNSKIENNNKLSKIEEKNFFSNKEEIDNGKTNLIFQEINIKTNTEQSIIREVSIKNPNLPNDNTIENNPETNNTQLSQTEIKSQAADIKPELDPEDKGKYSSYLAFIEFYDKKMIEFKEFRERGNKGS